MRTIECTMGSLRHISIKHEYVRHLIQDEIITILFVDSSGNLVDSFTKSLIYRRIGLKLLT